MSEEKFKKIISHAKEYGFVFQSSEIYDGLSAVYDYGQNGVLLKNNIKDYWWKSMINMNDNIVGLDPTKASLNLAKEFADKNKISNIQFINADIFDDVLNDEVFHFIWTNGVLHHTKDPYGAFKILIKSLN